MRKIWLILPMWPLLALPVSAQGAPVEHDSQPILNGKELPMEAVLA